MFCELHIDFTICSSLCQLTFNLACGGIFRSSCCKRLSASDRDICKFIAMAGVSSSGPLNTRLAWKATHRAWGSYAPSNIWSFEPDLCSRATSSTNWLSSSLQDGDWATFLIAAIGDSFHWLDIWFHLTKISLKSKPLNWGLVHGIYSRT